MLITDKEVTRIWRFAIRVKPGSVPDMKPWSGSKEMMRPDRLTIEIMARGEGRPVISHRLASGAKVLKDGTASATIRRDSHVYGHDDPVDWIEEFTLECLTNL